MNFDLIIGGGEVSMEFRESIDRDEVWNRLVRSYGWDERWASKRGDETSARSAIIIHTDLIPIAYRWRCAFQ